MAEDAPGFLGRWSRRKIDVLQGKPVEEPAPQIDTAAPSAPLSSPPQGSSVAGLPAGAAEPGVVAQPAEPPKVLSLEDVKELTATSDFKPFVGRAVAPEVRNAAMKKLFSDPHYNIMDGLDTYIDDYTLADPIPQSMLRQMVGSKLLKIFDDEVTEVTEATEDAGVAAGPVPSVAPNNPTEQSVAQSGDRQGFEDAGTDHPVSFSQPAPAQDVQASQNDHADTHLRLQQDHAPSSPPAGRGAA